MYSPSIIVVVDEELYNLQSCLDLRRKQEEEDAAAPADEDTIVELEEVAVTPAKKTNFNPIHDLQISSLTPLPTHP
ncbi:hypothetical protein CRG98_047686 [Punica granatum]|uniref:Uncharacterized protein n=1 Tax=Punica granatum TaxID=22663 RepID=A0A2I0HK08_PUNGR|nr:hypothetical protein CRG98_047686 [Punica granatum]